MNIQNWLCRAVAALLRDRIRTLTGDHSTKLEDMLDLAEEGKMRKHRGDRIMSKKTNAAKQKRQADAKRPRKMARRKPLFGIQLQRSRNPIGASTFEDPIILHHVLGFIMRTLELSHMSNPTGDHTATCIQCGKTREEVGNGICSQGPQIMHQWPRSNFPQSEESTPKTEVN